MEAKRRKVNSEESSERIGVTEKDVGISEYVSYDSAGFDGLIKQRFSDFQVNEIDLEGNVVILQDQSTPVAVKAESAPAKKPEEQRNGPEGEIKEDEVVNKELSEELIGILGQDFVNACTLLIESTAAAEKVKTDLISDKELRTRVHTLVREAFSGKLDSKTDNGAIIIQKLNKKSRSRSSNKVKAGSQAEFLHFTLYKENKETMEALSILARYLHIPSKILTFAGTKDRRAATSQRVCWRRGQAQRLSGLNNVLNESIRVGDFKYAKGTLKLGDLNGNQFWIAIRDVRAKDEADIDIALTKLRDEGFINYFGLQRFGTFSIPSHEIGKQILRGDFDGAIDSLLGPQSVTLDDSREAREVWIQSRDAERALSLMPRRCVAESSLLSALKDSDNALNALMRIPHSLKTMYVHAYQSYIWNTAASERVKLNRHEVIPGDLVLGAVEDGIQRARPVTESEVQEKKFSIFDIVLPTPGYDITYPANVVHVYENTMSIDGIDCHNMRRKIKDFSLFGAYRHILAKPLFLEWFNREFVNDDDTIIHTDREVLNGESKLTPDSALSTEPTAESSKEPRRKAIVLKLGLGTSQYATMALREGMKRDTSRNGNIYFKASS